MPKAFITTIQLHIDPFFAKDGEDAERIIDEYITKLAELTEQHAPELTWQECDTTPIEETDCEDTNYSTYHTCNCDCGCEVPLNAGQCVDCGDGDHQNNNGLDKYKKEEGV